MAVVLLSAYFERLSGFPYTHFFLSFLILYHRMRRVSNKFHPRGRKGSSTQPTLVPQEKGGGESSIWVRITFNPAFSIIRIESDGRYIGKADTET